VRRALISDIHGNLEALDAVLGDIAAQRISEIFCLGDVVGYGPNVRECIDRVMENCRVALLGNHEQAVIVERARSSGLTDRGTCWTWKQLNDPGDRIKNEIRKGFLMHLPRSYELGPYLFVHGSPRNPLSEYVFPEDIYNRHKLEHLFQLVRHYCFQGHTHVPGIITEDSKHFTPAEINGEYRLGEAKLMVNVGSVGQPRDGDNRACYVILDDGPNEDVGFGAGEGGLSVSSPKITYRRVPYDFETTVKKIFAKFPNEY
jgi:diadenosine tetraphosphatase ApaH/serine/threonine PP2A family protein phosphatase